jgi:hypothetical protein
MRTSKKGIPFRQRGKELRPFRALYRDLRRIEFWPDGEDGEMRIGWIEKSTRWSIWALPLTPTSRVMTMASSILTT